MRNWIWNCAAMLKTNISQACGFFLHTIWLAWATWGEGGGLEDPDKWYQNSCCDRSSSHKVHLEMKMASLQFALFLLICLHGSGKSGKPMKWSVAMINNSNIHIMELITALIYHIDSPLLLWHQLEVCKGFQRLQAWVTRFICPTKHTKQKIHIY